jgi:hypothetical protein
MSEQYSFSGMEDVSMWVDRNRRPDLSFVRELSSNWQITDDIGDCSYVTLFAYAPAKKGEYVREVGYVELKPGADGQTSCYVAHCMQDSYGDSEYMPFILAEDITDPLEACRLLEAVDADPRSVDALYEQSVAIWS